MTTRINQPHNQVHLTGYLCKMPRLTTSVTGKPMLTLVLAVDRPAHMPVKRRADDSVEPDYPPIVIDGEIATLLARFLKTGDAVTVEGIFQTRNYRERMPGVTRRRTAMEVLCATITLPRPATELDRTALEHGPAAPEPKVTVDLATVSPHCTPVEQEAQVADQTEDAREPADPPRPKRVKSHHKKKRGDAALTPPVAEPGGVIPPAVIEPGVTARRMSGDPVAHE